MLTCSYAIRQNIIEEVNRSSVSSVLAVEVADISDTEQLSIGVRYLLYDVKRTIVVKNFLVTRLFQN
jgi:hypothetical protein